MYSANQRDFSPRGSRLRKKHKRLDAICENVYNQNHNSEFNESRASGSGSASVADLELRRSTRVRRAPVVLDVSPPPVKKRRKVGKSVNLRGNRKSRGSLGSVKEEEVEEETEGATPGSWTYRLRSRGKSVLSGERGGTSGRRKLFDEMGTVVESEFGEKKGMLDGGKFMVVRSKRSGRVEVVDEVESGEEEGGMHGGEDVSGEEEGRISVGEDESGKDEMEWVGNVNEDGVLVLESGMGRVCEGGVVDSDVVHLGLGGGQEKERLDGLELEKSFDGHENVENVVGEDGKVEELESWKDGENSRDMENREQSDYKKEELVSGKDGVNEGSVQNLEQIEDKVEDLAGGMGGENEKNFVEVDRALNNEVADGGCHDEEVVLMEVDEMPLKGEKDAKVDKSMGNSTDTLGRPRFKQGRRCGLCGCGNDGKPPKRLVQDAGESENEAYSGSSASEEPSYDIWDGFGDEPGWLGRLLGPINDRYGIAGIWVHQHCAVWSPEVYFAGLGCLKNVRAALCRGRALKCSRCGRPGATIGCRVDRCPKTYHLPCARANGCIFDHRKFLIACTDHRHFFQPHGNQYIMRIKKLKAKKMKLEMRKLSNDAWRKDVEAEEKWLENCGEDEEFLKRESKRLHRDLLRIAPVYIGGTNSESGKLYEGWESVAGLQDVIQCMKEVVILPLLYPELFSNLGITPPRGVLLHGYPGTGKTLVVRALIGSCARGDKRIAYFARKGADCLGKYVGDAERQLRLLFQVAERCQPSIIFFDEIDGLAPCRTRQQDQTHSSVVSTLLALMDGLKSRGSVVVIGATNRPEAVDPALRRPGRFDREIYFPLPSVEDRAAILSLHTQKWPKPVGGSLLKWIARGTVGFAGADLQALCTQAAIIALKRNFPLQKILSASGGGVPGAKRHPLPAFAVEERDWLEALACAPPPCSRREAGIAACDLVSSPVPTHLIPFLLPPLLNLFVSLYLDERLFLPPPLSKAITVVKSVIVSSLEKKNLPSDHWWSHVENFIREADIAKEIQKMLSCSGMLIGEASCCASDAFTDEIDAESVKFEPSVAHNGGLRTSLFRGIPFASRKNSGFRVLIAGSPRSGQRHLASCILQCFVGNVEIQKVDLATVSQEGHGDMVQGITQILMKCASLQSCMIFMPRIDLWAVETWHQVTEESDASAINDQLSEQKESFSTDSHVAEELNESVHPCKAAVMAGAQGSTQIASHGWNSFVEQVESMCVSTSLIILATSELPHSQLPYRIRQFFKRDVSNDSQSSTLEHSVPRFSVHVDSNFNHDAVIGLSAAELSRDILQLFVQQTHRRAHICTSSSKEYRVCDSVQCCFDTEHHCKNHGAVNENEGRTQCTDGSSLKVPPPPNCRSLKGKSSLLLAISTFGYQILRYPHFAELCWVTSKLKEGPFADVSGPWKGWPFNSCIIRPADSLDKVAVAFSSGNMKSRERSGLVRGLVAVGLLAYRGVYKSLREVSFEVRKVLELLVGQVNEKIQAGKDRYQYVRLLSQVAYLEDMVNSWAYSLQSLVLDGQIKVASPKLSTTESPDNRASANNSVHSEECKGNVSNISFHELEWLEGSPQRLASENLEGAKLNGDTGSCHPNNEGRPVHSEDGFAQQNVLLDHTNSDRHCETSTVDNQVAVYIMNEPNGTTIGQIVPENTENLPVTEGNSESLKHSNGVTFAEPVLSSENGLSNSGEFCAFKVSGPGESCDQFTGLATMQGAVRNDDAKSDHSEHIEDINFCPNKASLCVGSGVVCFYKCCSGCLYTLHGMIQKIIVLEWESNKSNWTAEDVHDVVASLSMDLLSAVRKVDVADSISDSFKEKLGHGNAERLSTCPALCKCHCKSSGNNLLVPMECSCHSVDGSVTAKANSYSNSLFGLESKFVFRDGILIPVDSNKDFSFHCKYETLCLCSVIEAIVMMKKPFD